VTFIEGDARSGDLGGDFDAAVGRLVLMYWADPAAALRPIAGRVRPGGVIVFQEFDLDPAIPSWSFPEKTLWNETGQLVIETFARGGHADAHGTAALRRLRRCGPVNAGNA